MIKSTILLIVLVLAAACTWENLESLVPETGNCDTLDVSFAVDIVPLFTNHCYTCHSNENAPDFAGGIALEDYPDVSGASSLIVGAINHLAGFSAMPKDSDKLDSCSILTFEAWVNSGKPDN